MTEQATASITIEADRDTVLAVILDFERYPEWAGFVRSTQVLSRAADGRAERVRFVIDAGMLKADYTLVYSYDAAGGMSWTLDSGTLKENTGSYRLADRGDGSTEVTYSLAVDVGMPIPGILRRKAEQAVMDTALRDLKRRVEAG